MKCFLGERGETPTLWGRLCCHLGPPAAPGPWASVPPLPARGWQILAHSAQARLGCQSSRVTSTSPASKPFSAGFLGELAPRTTATRTEQTWLRVKEITNPLFMRKGAEGYELPMPSVGTGLPLTVASPNLHTFPSHFPAIGSYCPLLLIFL